MVNKPTSLLNVHLQYYLWSILKMKNQKNLLCMTYRAPLSLLEMTGKERNWKLQEDKKIIFSLFIYQFAKYLNLAS